MTGHTVLHRGAALADGLSPVLRKPVTIAVHDSLITGIFDGDAGLRPKAPSTP